jgi:hypothetical protein
LNIIASTDGLDIALERSVDAPEFFTLHLYTPEASYEFGDYPNVPEAHEIAWRLVQSIAWHLVRSRVSWCRGSPQYPWKPSVWQMRAGPRGDEYWRRGPKGMELATWEPFGSGWNDWRMYCGIFPIVRYLGDLGTFPTQWAAMDALDALAANRMRDALLD